jgi:hypothetical protein
MMKTIVNLICCLLYIETFAQIRNPDEVYNTACKWALAGKPDSAFKYLHVIVGRDYWKYTQLSGDADLLSLHDDPRWQPMLDKIRQAKIQPLHITRLYRDFDLMKSALEEAHTGLYWYNTKPAFDSICRLQRGKIREGMNVLQFYQVVAPVVSFTKEGHTFLRLGGQAQAYMQFSGRYFPLQLKFLHRQPYIVNGVGKGGVLTKINGISMEEIMQKFLSYEPADGYNVTSKYRWIERNGRFSAFYAYTYPMTDRFTIEVTDPVTGGRKIYRDIPAVSYDSTRKAVTEIPATLQIDSIAVLTFNTFSQSKYKASGMDFRDFVKRSFGEMNRKQIRHLVIDIRKNGGGTEGYEDYLLSFLIDQEYEKYSYVQASAFRYSFYANSDYKYDSADLEKMLQEEHTLQGDGRILRKAEVLVHEPPQETPFRGDIYVLTSGLTYSGGAEFAALVKEHTSAVFVGEEVGGGFYGNTSGNRIVLKMPYSKLEVGIPLLKFVVSTKGMRVPFGHGVIPDYEVEADVQEYLNGEDVEMRMVRGMIRTR